SFFCLSSAGCHRALHSFPTRRSSDLEVLQLVNNAGMIKVAEIDQVSPQALQDTLAVNLVAPLLLLQGLLPAMRRRGYGRVVNIRSEEHTSELQSRENLVCRLLLEKKK